VRFRDDVNVPYDPNDVGKYLDNLGIGPWSKLIEQHSDANLKIRSLLTSISPARLRELVAQAVERDATYEPPNFLSFCAVEFSGDWRAPALIDQLSTWTTISSVYPDPPGTDPAINPADDPHSRAQGYLDPAPDGIDAKYAWTFLGGDGAGQDLIDLEQGWTLNHEDLRAHHAKLLHGVLRDDHRRHGTSVLGEICAADNHRGCVGVAPNLRSVNVVSHFGLGNTKYDALMAAIAALPHGGVLLVEVQTNIEVGGREWINLPIEVLDDVFQAIRLATALGIIVVAAAGNGGHDLDTYADQFGRRILNRKGVGTGLRDSGAIMVAAATATHPHSPLIAPPPAPAAVITNFGSRIDCFGWGERITTTDTTETSPFKLKIYRHDFGATSGAAPIIAGAALVLQGIAEANLRRRFNAQEMRDFLTNPATSTLSRYHLTDGIGVMPNFRKIIDTYRHAWRLAPMP
jgi:serine protease